MDGVEVPTIPAGIDSLASAKEHLAGYAAQLNQIAERIGTREARLDAVRRVYDAISDALPTLEGQCHQALVADIDGT